ncbi:MAG TPA: VOC family protein [Thermoplasmata archaeon]|nr:VOC family protein [Thermoplasmata archaeon]
MVDVIDGLHAVTLHVRDARASRSYYRDVLGLSEVSFDEAANRAVFALPGTTTLLTMHVQGPQEGGREPGTVSGIVFRVADPVAACAEIVRRGGIVTGEPHEAEFAGRRFYRAVIADPDGNEFILSNRRD